MSGPDQIVTAEIATDREWLPCLETHLIPSGNVKQTFKVQVMRPARKRSESTRFPVVYVTDGNSMFETLRGISYSIQGAGGVSPRFILVGIGYPSDSPEAGSVLRARDMTFPGFPEFGTSPPPIEGVLTAEKGSKDFFGAEDFQRFIENELIPIIDEKYETLPGDRTYFGHSAGGSFGLFTLFTKPCLFRNYILSSPAVVCHGELSSGRRYDNYDFLLQTAKAFVESGKALENHRLYLSVGTEEEFEAAYAPWQLTSGFYRVVALLKAIAGLHLTHEAFNGETHVTVWPIAFIHGVRAVFGTDQARR